MKKMRSVLKRIFESLGVLGVMSIGEKQYKAEIMSGQPNTNN